MKYKKKKCRIVKYSKRFMIGTSIIFIFSTVILSSYESSVNIEKSQLESEIQKFKAQIDGLDMKKSELTSFTRIETVSTNKGYHYRLKGETVVVSKK